MIFSDSHSFCNCLLLLVDELDANLPRAAADAGEVLEKMMDSHGAIKVQVKMLDAKIFILNLQQVLVTRFNRPGYQYRKERTAFSSADVSVESSYVFSHRCLRSATMFEHILCILYIS